MIDLFWNFEKSKSFAIQLDLIFYLFFWICFLCYRQLETATIRIDSSALYTSRISIKFNVYCRVSRLGFAHTFLQNFMSNLKDPPAVSFYRFPVQLLEDICVPVFSSAEKRTGVKIWLNHDGLFNYFERCSSVKLCHTLLWTFPLLCSFFRTG